MLAIVILAASPQARASGGPFGTRAPGVSAGTWAVYDTWFGPEEVQQRLQVNSALGTDVNFTLAYSFNGTVYQVTNLRLNTLCGYDAVLNQTTGARGCELPYPGVYFPFFVAGGLAGGDQAYLGDFALSVQVSLFGHVVAGNHRSTVYADDNEVTNEVYHVEWDQSTGMMTSYLFEGSSVGISARLLSTNAWPRSFFWSGIGGAVSVFWAVLPVLASLGAMYFVLFIFAALKDWAHMRALRAARSGKTGGMMWMQIKIMVIASLIVVAILITALVVLTLALR